MAQSLRLAVRSMVRSPGVFGISLLVLALAIGSNTAVFTVVNAVLLRALPYPQSDRIVALQRAFRSGNSRLTSVPKFFVWKTATADLFSAIAAYDFRGPGLALGREGTASVAVKTIHVTRDFFAVFGVEPAAGRFFTAEEDTPGGPHVAVITAEVWTSAFGRDPRLPGSTLLLAGEPYQVVGVTAASFESDPAADVFLPLQADPNSRIQADLLWSAGRLKPGKTAQEVTTRLQGAAEAFRGRFPTAMAADESATAVSMYEIVTGNIRPTLLIVLGAVLLVQLIACANVASLMLIRGVGQTKAMAIRSSLGAPRWRLVLLPLTESLVLGVTAGVLGLLLGRWLLGTLLAFTPPTLPRLAELTTASGLDLRVATFTFALSLVTALTSAMVPMQQIARADLTTPLKDDTARGSAGPSHLIVNSAIVIAEIALSLVLLVGAGLLIRSAMLIDLVPSGFDADRVLSFRTSLASSRYKTTAAVSTFSELMVQHLETVPGVTAAACVTTLPTEGGPSMPLQLADQHGGAPETAGVAAWRAVSPKYFEALGIRLIAGRPFALTDTATAPAAAIINRRLAERYWPGQSAVGQHIVFPRTGDAPREIVGVIADVRELGPQREPPVAVYVPQTQVLDVITAQTNRVVPLAWVVRTSADPVTLAEQVRRQAMSVDPEAAILEVTPMRNVVRRTTAFRTFALALLTIFASVAMVLSAVGMFAVVSYFLAQRHREIAIRAALGADSPRLLRLLLRHGTVIVVAGVLLGLGAAYGLSRLLQALLFGVGPTDPTTFALGSIAISLIAMGAVLIPAWRAASIVPSRVLRS